MAEEVRLGGFQRRERPLVGFRPTIRFSLAVLLTATWVGFAVWVSQPWRSDLEQEIGPIMSWTIPIALAYVPGAVIGFPAFTLAITRYHPPLLDPPRGPWPVGEWPPSR